MTNNLSAGGRAPYESLWQALEEESRGVHAAGMVRRRITSPEARALFLGFQIPENRRVFLLRVAKSYLAQTVALSAMRGVEVWAAALPSDEPSHASLGLTLREPRFSDIFSALVEDLIGHITGQPDDAKALAAFVSRVTKWHRFLESHAEGLGEESQRGLWGELRFLHDHVIPRLGGIGIEGWMGAHKTPQDFQFSNCAIEVKTSAAKQLQTLHISNERQLDDSHVSALFLYHLSLEPLRGTGETLPQSVEAVRITLASDDAAREKFEDKLLEAGYLDAHAERYGSVGYSVREENLFRVRDGFPCLKEGDLRPGVGEVSYAISVNECRPFAASAAELDAALLLQPAL